MRWLPTILFTVIAVQNMLWAFNTDTYFSIAWGGALVVVGVVGAILTGPQDYNWFVDDGMDDTDPVDYVDRFPYDDLHRHRSPTGC
jgi:hypothetical protein